MKAVWRQASAVFPCPLQTFGMLRCCRALAAPAVLLLTVGQGTCRGLGDTRTVLGIALGEHVYVTTSFSSLRSTSTESVCCPQHLAGLHRRYIRSGKLFMWTFPPCGLQMDILFCFQQVCLASGMNAFHLALDPLFIYAAGWGVSGAAAATVVAEVGAAAAYGVCIWQRRDVLGARSLRS